MAQDYENYDVASLDYDKSKFVPIPSCCVLISIASFAQPATLPSLCVEEEEQEEETSGHSEQELANILHPCLQAMPSRIAFHFRVKPVYGSHGHPTNRPV